MAEDQKKNTTEIYEIKIQEHLDTRWSDWLYGLTITHEHNDVTTLRGSLPDQTVLHSVLDRIRDMNMTLISVNQIASNGQINDYEVKGVNHDE
ncbi:MAG TPA: hypothetical protein VIS72_12915 [Anaerolineales bacterium]